MANNKETASWTVDEAIATIHEIDDRLHTDAEYRSNAYSEMVTAGLRPGESYHEQEVAHILKSAGRLNSADRIVLIDALVAIVEDEEPDLDGPWNRVWLVALDTLFAMATMDGVRALLLRSLDESVVDGMQEEARQMALPALETLLRTSRRERPYELVRLLAKAAYRPGLDIYISYIRAVQAIDPGGARELIAPLARIDAELSVQMAAELLAQFPPGDPQHYITTEDSVSQFLLPYLEQDRALAPRLVQETNRRNPEAGRSLREVFTRALSDAWLQARFGRDEMTRLREAIDDQFISCE